MEYVLAVRDFAEQIMGIFLILCVFGGLLSCFGGGDKDRYNGAGTLDQNG